MDLKPYAKAFVPLVIGAAYFVNNRWGINLNIGEPEAIIIISLITGMLTYLIPNKPQPIITDTQTTQVIQTSNPKNVIVIPAENSLISRVYNSN